MNKERKLYLETCEECDTILNKLGIRDICRKCSTAPKKFFFINPGCCQGCNYNSKNGCTTQSLSCKVWFCTDWMRALVINSEFGERWKRIERTIFDSQKSIQAFGCDVNKHRKGVDDFPELREDRTPHQPCYTRRNNLAIVIK